MTKIIDFNNYNFDGLLENIHFSLNDYSEYWTYKTHPEYLPFVGDKYYQHKDKILLVLESHYLDEHDSENLYNLDLLLDKTDQEINRIFSDYWYDRDVWLLKRQQLCIENTTFFNTRFVANCAINEIAFDNCVLLEPSHQYCLGRNINSAKYTSTNSRNAIRNFSYMNFFQRPSLKTGVQITREPIDIEVASRNLIEVINVLRPEVIVFISAKSYDTFYRFLKKNKINTSNSQIKSYRFRQPGTRYWCSKTKKEILDNSLSNQQKLQELFRKLI